MYGASLYPLVNFLLQVTPPTMDPCHLHSMTASKLAPGLTEILMFGGRVKWQDDPITNTTILTFGKGALMSCIITCAKYTLVESCELMHPGGNDKILLVMQS